MKRFLLSLLMVLVFCEPAFSAVATRVIAYKSGGTKMMGFLAYNTEQTEKRPGILVVHEWWGHNAYARSRALMLAKLGYTALAVDMYGNGKRAKHPDDAGKFAGEVRENMPVAEKRFRAAINLLKEQPNVDGRKIAAIGYCFGGGIVLEMARRSVPLKGVVSFHGSLETSTPAKKGGVRARVLVFNGADDPMVTQEQIDTFKNEMDTAGVKYTFINYPGAKHSFTNSEADKYGKKFDLPLAYDPQADKDSWQKMLTFFDRIFGK